MILFNPWMEFLLKYQVVHSLPGRLRLHVPIIKKIPPEWQVEDNVFFEFFQLIPGVKNVSFSYMTANVLMVYDESVINESQILLWIRRISEVILKYSGQLKVSTPERLVKVLKDLMPEIRKELQAIS